MRAVARQDDAGKRLDAFLGAFEAVGSRARAARLIEAGQVTVGGEPRAKRYALGAGDIVEVDLEVAVARVDPQAGASVEYGVIHEDDWLLVVDKPAGVVTHPAPGHPTGTLSQALAARGAAGGDSYRPGIVHRLDRDTSGLLVVAKSEAVHRALQELIRTRAMQRQYLALVEGRPDARTGTIDAAIGRDRRSRTLQSTSTATPREAVTHFEIERELPRTTLLAVRLETGRTHQIRVHLAAIGHPVVGDAQYGGKKFGQRLGLTRQFLHAEKLGFEHPVTRAVTTCESKLPADLRPILDAAAREPASVGPDRS